MIKKISLTALLLAMMFSPVVSVYGEEIFGIQVYPGAKLDSETTQFLKDSLKLNGAAYRTTDSVEKVTAFYKGQKVLALVLEKKGKAGFMKGSYELTVTIQNPWRNMRTGQVMTDTLISIAKPK
jgi:hypothetical protein